MPKIAYTGKYITKKSDIKSDGYYLTKNGELFLYTNGHVKKITTHTEFVFRNKKMNKVYHVRDRKIRVIIPKGTYVDVSENKKYTVTDGVWYHCKEKSWDYIVVGAGSAGCLVAKNLAQTGKSVLCLEAGENRSESPLIKYPFLPTEGRPGINLTNATDDPRTAFVYQSITTAIPQENFTINKDSRIRFRVGRVVGGGSAKNLLSAVRGSPEYHEDLIKNYTNDGWTNYTEIYQAIETYTGNQNTNPQNCRGDNGLIHVRQVPPPAEIPESTYPEFPEMMATVAGVQLVNDYNDCQNAVVSKTNQQFLKQEGNLLVRSFSGNEYFGSNVLDQKTGKGKRKWKSLKLITGATVSKLLFKKCNGTNISKGVCVVRKGCYTHYRSKKVILCAGAINDAAILQRSGIGPKVIMDNLKIDPIYINENVGSNLLDHVGPSITIQVDKSIRPVLQVGFQAYLDIGPTGVVFGGSRRTVQFITLAGLSNLDPSYVKILNIDTSKYNYFTFLCWNLNPVSKGKINIVSKDPLTYPEVDPKFYKSSENTLNEDILISQQAILYIKKVVDQLNVQIGSNAYKIIYPLESDIDSSNPSKLNDYIGNLSVTDHPSGTCSMNSVDLSKAVVDDKLRLIGVKGVRIADTSIFPIIPDGNTCMPAYFAGGKLVEFETGKVYDNNNPF